MGALLVGVSFVKALAFASGKPFSALDHIEAHLFSPLLATADDGGKTPPPFPWIALVVSGGHSELFHVRSQSDWTWLGGTLDDAAGEAFDKIGKLLGLPYPAGPRIDKWVREKATEQDRRRFPFPRAKTEPFHFSYSGLKTAVSLQVKADGDESLRLAAAASAQEAILDPLVEKVREAQARFNVPNAVITGGVACNSRLRAKFPEAFFPAPRHCTDNAAMVAVLAALKAREGTLAPSPFTTGAQPRMETP
jgi:N6-L-threonylcarbamoyladenine synthase